MIISKQEIYQRIMENNIREIIQLIGDNPKREGLLDTPKRVAKMYLEVFNRSND